MVVCIEQQANIHIIDTDDNVLKKQVTALKDAAQYYVPGKQLHFTAHHKQARHMNSMPGPIFLNKESDRRHSPV